MAPSKRSGRDKGPKSSASLKSESASPKAGKFIDLNGVKALAELMDTHDLVELEVSDSGVRLSKRGAGAVPMVMPALAAAPSMPAGGAGASGGGAADAKALDGKGARPPDVMEFVSPMVGTFYRASNPEAKAYVAEGDRIDENSVLCIIEAMKVMNEIKAEMKGQVVEVLVENGEAVEFGQPLFLIKKP